MAIYTLKLLAPILLCLSVQRIQCAEFDYTILVDAGKIDCFFQNVSDKSHAVIEIDYQVVQGGDFIISFTLTDPRGRILAADVRKMDNSKRVNISGLYGGYKICFDNSFSGDSKMIFFQITLEDEFGNSDDFLYEKLSFGEIQGTRDLVEILRDSCAKVKNNLNKAEAFQSALRVLEARDRALMENNRSRVNFWSAVALTLMVLVGLAQVFTIKTLFIEESSLAKFLRSFT